MAGKMSVVVVACLVALLEISSSVAATSYTVGDTTGWTYPSSTTFYSDWASGKTFNVNDILVFNLQGAHTVTEVTKSDYDSCSTTSPISDKSTSTVSITLTAGTHYYICTKTGHCDAGQKLSVTVGSSTTPSATSPSSTTSSPPPPPSSSAVSTAAGLVMPFLLVAAVFLF